MNGKATLFTILMFVLVGMLGLSFNVQKVEADNTIYIRADGTIDPPTANITTFDNVTYAFTDNNYDSIVIERDNIIVDGAGFTLQATSGTGIDLSYRSNVTIKNMKIERCGQQTLYASGIFLDNSWNNTIFNVEITNTRGAAISLSSSSDNIIHHNFLKNNNIELYQTSNNRIYNNTIVGSSTAIDAKGTGDHVYYNNLTETNYGIEIIGESNTVYGNTVTNDIMVGISVSGSGNNVSGNTITECKYGLILSGHRGNILRENTMMGNYINFGITSIGYMETYNDVDNSNTVDGKPIYYWNNRRDNNIPSDAGAVILVDCINITVNGLFLEKNIQGILLVSSNNCTVSNNTFTENGAPSYVLSHSGGIVIQWSSENIILGNNITNNNDYGICMVQSSNITISENTVTKNRLIGMDALDSNYTNISKNNFLNNLYGIRIGGFTNAHHFTISENNITGPSYYGIQTSAKQNNITDNNIVYNQHGIYITSQNNIIVGNNILKNYETGVYIASENNTFHHNNFVDNANHVTCISGYFNYWDDGYPSGGNYWTEYEARYPNATELDNSGIWNISYVINEDNIDHYPLMAPTEPITREFTVYDDLKMEIYSNSSISELQFDATGKKLSFNVTGPAETDGFCNVIIPENLLWGNFSLFINGIPLVEGVNYTKMYNGTHYTFFITYIHSEHTIEIRGTEAIPEFSLAIILPLTIILSITAIIFAKKAKTTQT